MFVFSKKENIMKTVIVDSLKLFDREGWVVLGRVVGE